MLILEFQTRLQASAQEESKHENQTKAGQYATASGATSGANPAKSAATGARLAPANRGVCVGIAWQAGEASGSVAAIGITHVARIGTHQFLAEA